MKFSTVVLALSAVVAMVQAAPVTVPGDIPLGVHGPEALDIQINLPIEIGDDSSPHKRDLSSFVLAIEDAVNNVIEGVSQPLQAEVFAKVEVYLNKHVSFGILSSVDARPLIAHKEGAIDGLQQKAKDLVTKRTGVDENTLNAQNHANNVDSLSYDFADAVVTIVDVRVLADI
ncbi:hypothetical protein BGX31_002737 [Mortierella sp. GBA43]|nr:hypothetical protein BGX31_002737 [Mortierella sp. GBA43]